MLAQLPSGGRGSRIANLGFSPLIQVGIRPDRRARGMLHIYEGGTFPLLGVTPVRGTSKMEVFWGRWGTRGTLGDTPGEGC